MDCCSGPVLLNTAKEKYTTSVLGVVEYHIGCEGSFIGMECCRGEAMEHKKLGMEVIEDFWHLGIVLQATTHI